MPFCELQKCWDKQQNSFGSLSQPSSSEAAEAKGGALLQMHFQKGLICTERKLKYVFKGGDLEEFTGDESRTKSKYPCRGRGGQARFLMVFLFIITLQSIRLLL